MGIKKKSSVCKECAFGVPNPHTACALTFSCKKVPYPIKKKTKKKT